MVIANGLFFFGMGTALIHEKQEQRDGRILLTNYEAFFIWKASVVYQGNMEP